MLLEQFLANHVVGVDSVQLFKSRLTKFCFDVSVRWAKVDLTDQRPYSKVTVARYYVTRYGHAAGLFFTPRSHVNHIYVRT